MARDPDRDLIDNMNSALTEDIHNILEKVLAVQLKPILASLVSINGRLDNLEKEQKRQGRDIKKIKETLDVMIRSFNREDVQLHKRVKRIEDHLDLPRLV